MDCTPIRSVLECYADRELDALASRDVEAHLSKCADCRRALEGLNAFRVEVKGRASYHEAPANLGRDLRARIAAELEPVPAAVSAPSGHAWWTWLRPAGLVAATAAVTWMFSAYHYAGIDRDALAEDIFAGHARAMVTGRLTDIASSDRHTVKPWLGHRLDYSPPVIDLATAGFPLIGARLDYVDRRPVAALVYGRRKHIIDVFVWPEGDARGDATSAALSRQGYQVRHWNAGGLTFWAVSDLNAAELKAFTEQFAAGG